ncbi:patatin-like phospholipase family protein [candidate division KSB1 bacterium]|nr:patatin-like phospholipase family protein [candidate division KSB1 bacterium]NIR71434.1 patatin-like phospholipase family protein [candidate division KSB1 bacterium]NIS23355.1 patatin-like phospholipase family protein [candidate division KSB1 bacterium]NIT70246.1 patatin-like phospholipase family protein [candidate division KSB1 bacterium]NIU23969.1 patatin-like phospholipase family protein [candidate division KSB1 bacterium]
MLTKKKNKTALCLAGGGLTGSMYEIGCLKALDEIFEEPHCVNDFDIFVGVSAGAVVSALVANGYKPIELYEGIAQHTNSTLDFKRKNIYDLRLSEIFEALVPLFKRLPALIRYGWKNRQQATFMDLLSIMQEFIPAGIFSLHNLDKFVSGLLYPDGKTNDFRNLEKELYIPATELDTAKRWVFGEGENNQVPISKAVAASAAIPIFFRPYRINGHDFIDGSTSHVAHLDLALEHGAKLIIIINPTYPLENDFTRVCLPTFDGGCARLVEKGMGLISDQARRIETKTRFELGFERFRSEHPEADYIIIQPKPSDDLLFLHGVMDFDSRKSILSYGYNSTKIFLNENLDTFRSIFEKHKIKTRKIKAAA